ncbi:hypothetical protein [Mesorhizobium sp. NZP2077]|uniref:hypothetical protein n=1 Tax=Mesorhizobium sp. NZP2077 TaxID=2483404 RepID=UPI00155551C9|nr:hypothetical protein [Mesorhizobium sp. NZP2077]QKC86612.1 hypothetical protein EB232_30855 [Mesorhizobium sp. NZP2077]QKD19015.1 hypothetical protein HGP13_30555 [Mesorhizobium sp. NZP2077]
MAKIKNLNAAIAKEPETAGVEIERKDTGAKDSRQTAVNPKTAGASAKANRPLADPFPAKQSDARPGAGKTPRPTDNPGE